MKLTKQQALAAALALIDSFTRAAKAGQIAQVSVGTFKDIAMIRAASVSAPQREEWENVMRNVLEYAENEMASLQNTEDRDGDCREEVDECERVIEKAYDLLKRKQQERTPNVA